MFHASYKVRQFKKKLQELADAEENKALCCENETRRKLQTIRDKEYAVLLSELCEEEKKEAEQEMHANKVKNIELKKVIEEQIERKNELKDKDMEVRELEKCFIHEEAELWRKQRESELAESKRNQRELLEALDFQVKMKDAQMEESLLEAKQQARISEDYALLGELKKEVALQQEQGRILQIHLSQIDLGEPLARCAEAKEELRVLRLEKEIIEHQEKADLMQKEEVALSKQRERDLHKDLLEQIKLKEKRKQNEKQIEEEYADILMCIQAEESHLHQFTQEAQRRKKLLHRELAERVVLERRQLLRLRMEKDAQEDIFRKKELEMRKDLLLEEEKQLIMRHAPHLVPYITPEILTRWRQLL